MTSRVPETPVTACPGAEQLATYADGGLPAAERATVEQHLAQCGDCREIVAGAVALPALPQHRAASRRLWIAATVLVAAAAIIVVVRGALLDYDARTSLRAALGSTRAVEPRLTGDLPYRPLAPTTRSAADATPPSSLVAAAASIETRVLRRRTAENLRALGQAQLLLGDVDGAIAALDEAGQLAAADRPIQSDRASAYLARAAQRNRTADYAIALRDIDAIGAPIPVEALFNRALALEGLGRRREAAAAWKAYLSSDATSGWASEARAHLARLGSAED